MSGNSWTVTPVITEPLIMRSVLKSGGKTHFWSSFVRFGRFGLFESMHFFYLTYLILLWASFWLSFCSCAFQEGRQTVMPDVGCLECEQWCCAILWLKGSPPFWDVIDIFHASKTVSHFKYLSLYAAFFFFGKSLLTQWSMLSVLKRDRIPPWSAAPSLYLAWLVMSEWRTSLSSAVTSQYVQSYNVGKYCFICSECIWT